MRRTTLVFVMLAALERRQGAEVAAATVSGPRPDTAMLRLDNALTDRQPDADPRRLARR